MTLTQMRRASSKMNLQGPRSAATLTIKTCLCLPPDALSLVLQPIAIHRTHLHPHTNPHSRVRGTSPAQSPAGSFLGGFRTTALVLAAPSRWAVIRNPEQKQTFAMGLAGSTFRDSRADIASPDRYRPDQPS